MNAERLQQIESVFAEVLTRAPADRERALVERCGEDAELLRDVRSLLAASDGGAFDAFHEEFAAELGGPPGSSGPGGAVVGMRIGRYVLGEEIGRGGMGTVYRARRADGAFEQQVALKLLRSDLDADELRERLRFERQILAQVTHPNIARLLDGGVTPDGRPFLVMEYVDGERVDAYSDERNLPIADRLELFRTVCGAVQHVHRHLVVHRDIKPGNIFVTRDGRPMLLDFGIAKLLDRETLAGEGKPTRTAARFFTPEYASPEQIRGEVTTTANDVYQLGVLLFELLTGRRPFPGRGRTRMEIERLITEGEPPRPSEVVLPSDGPNGDDGDACAVRSRNRGTTPERLERQLVGDLDNIVLKAIRREPERRYASVGDLAEDVRRFQSSLPVTARPDSVTYRLGKFVGRHRVALASSAAVLIAVVGFAGNTVVQSARVARERDRAQQVSDLLVDLFSSADPMFGNDSLTVGDFLDRGARRVETGAMYEPRTRADLMAVLGDVFWSLDRWDDAERLWTNALEVERSLGRERSVEVASLAVSLSKLRIAQGRGIEADSLARDAIANLDVIGHEASPLMGTALSALAYARQVGGSLDSAALLYERALSMLDSNTAWATRAQTIATLNLGYVEQARGDFDTAEFHFREALRLRERVYGPESPSNAAVLEALAALFRRRGQLDSATAAAERAFAILDGAIPSPHRALASNLHVRALIRADQRDTAAADSLFARSLAMTNELNGTGSLSVAVARLTNDYAVALERWGDLSRAERLYRQSVAAYRAGFGEEHVYGAIVESNLAWVLAIRGNTSEAAAAYRHALHVIRHSDLDPSWAAKPSSNYGELLLRQGDAAAAESLFAQASDLWLTSRPANDNDVLRAQVLRGVALTRLGRYELAESLLREALARHVETNGPAHEYTRLTRDRLVELYDAWGRAEDAAALREPIGTAPEHRPLDPDTTGAVPPAVP